MWLSSRHRCTSQNSTTTFEKKKKIREKVYGKKIFCSLWDFFSFWEGVDDFWSVSNSRRHRCNRKAICPYRICYVISQDWASFFSWWKMCENCKCIIFSNRWWDPFFSFFGSRDCWRLKEKDFPLCSLFLFFFRTPKGGKSYASSIPKRQVKTLPKEE